MIFYLPAHVNGYEVKQILMVLFLPLLMPWPGFTPDLLSIVLVVATQARGDVLIHQKMFESRLFVDKLIDMGAKIMLCDPHRAVVMGHDFKSQLKAKRHLRYSCWYIIINCCLFCKRNKYHTKH
jgi:UDP-N-acetylglucosamine 1-carboxyvinyltransferase